MPEELHLLVEDVLSQRDMLVRAIIMDGVLAEGIAEIASQHEGDAPHSAIERLRRLSRHHRIKAPELRGRLAALEAKYSAIFSLAR